MTKFPSEMEDLKCVRCGASAYNSGVPSLCVECSKRMEALTHRLGIDIRVEYMKGWKVEKILRMVRKDCLETLMKILQVEREIEQYE